MLRLSRTLLKSTRPRCVLGSRRFHASRASRETITVPSASNGSISLDVYAPEKASQTAPGNVAIFLPRGPICKDEASDAANIALLRSSLSCHVVQINYRYGSLSQYPMPVHDVATGFDWIVSNLLPKRAILRAGRSSHVGKLSVCGELLGGQLATMLALTECRIGEPGIIAAAINNPIADWVSLDEDNSRMKISTAQQELTVEALLKHRNSLFRKPEHYHDPFASPILFFRTSGCEVAEDEELRPPVLDELDELAQLERQEYLREQRPVVPDITNPETLTTTRVRMRKSSRRFPSRNFFLRLPRFSITAGVDSPIAGQADELAHVLEQSFARGDKMKSLTAETTDRVRLGRHPGLGLWDTSSEGRARMGEVAGWMAESLGA